MHCEEYLNRLNEIKRSQFMNENAIEKCINVLTKQIVEQ